jgi:hypothetical protein
MQNIVRLAVAVLLVGTVGAALGAQEAKTSTVQGKVTAVTGSSLTIEHDSHTMTFMVDNTTKVIGKGVGTKREAKAKAKEKFTILEAVETDDRVTVKYHEMGGKMHASEVQITQKKLSATK